MSDEKEKEPRVKVDDGRLSISREDIYLVTLQGAVGGILSSVSGQHLTDEAVSKRAREIAKHAATAFRPELGTVPVLMPVKRTNLMCGACNQVRNGPLGEDEQCSNIHYTPYGRARNPDA